MSVRNRKTTHDFLSERKWLTFLAGFQSSNSICYAIYRWTILLSIAYILTVTVCCCVWEPRKQLIVKATHSIVIDGYYVFWCLAMRLGLYRSMEKLRAFVNTGVYLYEDEEDDPVLMELKTSMPKEIRSKSNMFVCMFYFAGITTTTLFPLSQVALHDPEHDYSVMNPFLPHLFYQPFDTTSLLGTAIGWALGCAIFFFMYTINCTVNWYYISGVVQMRVHYRVLNHSISNVESRALKMYTKSRRLPTGIPPSQLLDDLDFQRCLYLSFRANVQHHQALLRFRKLFEPFSGSFTLCVFTLAPIVYGCLLYLMYQESPINFAVNLYLTFAADMFTVIYICFLGQDLYSESEGVFSKLYSIDWFNYNKSVNQMIQIMMCNTLRPVGVKALLLGVPATLETYSNVMTAMYKVTSLVRQSDLV